MSWPLSLLVAVVTAAVGLFASGFVANLAVGWYRVSGFEGGSGYFVVSLALLGGVVGGIVGLVAARNVDGALRAFGLAQAIVLGAVALVGGSARALADVPPTLDGEHLVLAVEVRWPASQTARPTAPGPDEPRLELGALAGHTRRVSRAGPLWIEDARQEEGRWVAPGAVDVFTNRGRRMLSLELGDPAAGAVRPGVLLPMRRPTAKDTAWSEWMPRAREGAPPLPDGFQFRYRVRRASEPLRVEPHGALEVVTSASGFRDVRDSREAPLVVTAHATFAVRHRGVPVAVAPEGGTVDEIAALTAGPRAALLAQVTHADRRTQECRLVVDDGESARVETVAECYGLSTVRELTADPARYERSKQSPLVPGRFDRRTFDAARYLFAKAVVDVPALAVHRFESHDGATGGNPPPLSVSPDGRSFARFAHVDGSAHAQALVVTDVVADTVYRVPIDPVRTRMPKFDRLSPAWANHYFGWTRGADGVDRLAERHDVKPLAYRGRLDRAPDGLPYYWIEPAGEALREALVAFLAREMGGERLAGESGDHDIALRVAGEEVRVSADEDSRYVAVFPPHAAKEARIIPEIARRFDAELATGKHDALFGAK